MNIINRVIVLWWVVLASWLWQTQVWADKAEAIPPTAKSAREAKQGEASQPAVNWYQPGVKMSPPGNVATGVVQGDGKGNVLPNPYWLGTGGSYPGRLVNNSMCSIDGNGRVCGGCSVACPPGRAAYCVPGIESWWMGRGQCLRSPSCYCR